MKREAKKLKDGNMNDFEHRISLTVLVRIVVLFILLVSNDLKVTLIPFLWYYETQKIFYR